MQNTRQIRQRIKTAGNISKITKAMEMVSASKMRRAQAQALASRPYTRALQKSLATAAHASDVSLHPFLQTHEQGTDIALLISTDKGLCGSLNPNLFKSALQWAHAHSSGQFVVVGKKAVAFAKVANLPLFAQFTDLPEKLSFSDIVPITTLLMSGFSNLKIRTVTVIYMDFVSTLVQRVNTIPLLPITSIDQPEEAVLEQIAHADYSFEPSAKDILHELMPFYVENSIFQSFLESKASEHSARMVSMKNASENAKDLMAELGLEYNKSRQASVTGELLDITTARLAQT